MTRRLHRQRCLFAGVFFACAIVGAWWLVDRPAELARATPHTVSHVPHPFDPDWPDVYLILANKCAGCHRVGSENGDVSSYEALMAAGHENQAPLVVPNDAEDSLLWQFVSWNAAARSDADLPKTPEMPQDHREWLTTGQQETIRRWINNGAKQFAHDAPCLSRSLMEIDFPSAKQCAACHPKQYAEWSRSMHAYAQLSPIAQAFNLTLQERTSGTLGTFCTRCHTPIGTALGENGLRRNMHRSRLSLEGITCIACHRRKDGRYKSSGRIRVEPGTLLETCVFGPFDDAAHVEGNHPTAKHPYIKSAQFCGECHDVTSPNGVRLEEAFSEWQRSPAAKSGITCQHCHMGPVQGIPIPDHERPLGRAATVPGVDPKLIPLRPLSDHTFAGPDYSLLPDTEFPHKLDWMYEKDYRDTARLTQYERKSLTELRRSNRAHLRKARAKRLELLGNSAEICVRHPDHAQCGQKVNVGVDVLSKVAGHSLPTGFTAERQLWLSAKVYDPSGEVVFSTGDLDSNGDLRDDHSRDVMTGRIVHDRHLLNFQSKFLALTSKGTERSVVLSVNRDLQPLNVIRPAPRVATSFGRPPTFRIAKGSLPPLATVRKKFPVRLPNIPGTYTVDVRLNFRHLPPTLLDQIGTPHLKHLLEIVVIDHYKGVILVESD